MKKQSNIILIFRRKKRLIKHNQVHLFLIQEKEKVNKAGQRRKRKEDWMTCWGIVNCELSKENVTNNQNLQ